MVEIEVEYKAGHTYKETYCKSDMFCPRCGTKSVWEEQGSGDYYVGPNCVCLDCGINFTVQVGQRSGRQSPEELQRTKQLKLHSLATTPPGVTDGQ